jgi:hypothetical protein
MEGSTQDDEYKERSAQLLTANSKQILDVLSMYANATGAVEISTLAFCLTEAP